MASGIGLSIDTSFLQSLENADKKIKDLTNKTNHLSRVTVQAFQQMANGGVAPYIEQLNRQKKALEEIGKIKGTSPFLTKMQADAKVAIDEINNLIKALERTKAYRGEMSGRTAISFANSVLGQRGEAKSIDNMKLAISQLEAAQNRLNLNTKTGQKNYEKIGETIKKVKDELDKATGANKKLTQENEKTKGTVKGLGGAISAAFAVNAIRGFLNNLIKVRGEFELQHKSLQVLLQDVDEANELWDKTIALAVKSPYRVKELVTYTKQLAAYRVESEKLYDTTRMLADVSAGLGVDMNRLILAFGQVKAANFLRGTELRQFSEAGVNLLEELSKRFTKLEGRAVSVGDVFERVSKRMVKFADVEAVFQTITSEGGVFYQMQEKQSETLRGMIMNLKDSVDLMFNEMGKASDSPLKGAIRLVRELVENWRKFIPIVSAAGSAFLAAFSVKVIASIGAAFSALWGIISANPIGAAITLITALVAGIVSAKNKVNELTAAMNEVDRDVTKQLEDSITLYRKLAEQVRDVTSTEKERNKAMEQLKSRFGDILPDQLLELEYIQGISDNYKEATDAMMNYYNAKATEQKKDRVESQFGEKIDTEVVDLIQGTRNMISTWREKGLIGERDKVALLSGVGAIVRGVSEGIKNGEIDNNFDSVRRALLQKLSEYSGVDATWDKYIQGGGSMLFEKNISEMIRQITNYRAAIEGIEGLPTETYAEKEAKNIFLPEKENIEATKNAFKEITNLVSEYSNLALDKWGDLDERFNALITKLPQEMVEYIPLLSEMFEKMKVAAAGGAFEFGKSIQGFQQEFTRALPQIMWSQTSEGMFSPISEEINNELISLVDNMDETLQKEADKLDLSKFQKSVVSAMEVIAKETGVNVDKFAKFIPKISDSLSTTRTSVKQQIDLLKMDVTTWTESLKVDQENLNVLRPEALDLTQKQIDETNILIKAYEMLWKFLGGEDKGKKKTNNTIEERIKVVDQMNKKYLELNKTLSKGESLKGAFAAYKDAFATAYDREDVRTMSAEDFAKKVLNFPDEDEIVNWLKDLAKTVSKKEDKFKVEIAIGKFEMDKTVRNAKKQDKELFKEIQDMFDQYELSLELKKLHISPEVAKSLFGIESLGLADIRKKVEEELASARATEGQEDRVKQLEKDLEKVNDMEDKAQIERLTTYLKYTRAAIGERAKIKVEEMTKLQEIDETFTKAMNEAKTEEDKKRIAEQKKLAEEGVRREASEKTHKLDWEDFKASDTFINLFNDLDNASSDLINHTITQIEKFKTEWTDMPVESAKEMALKLNDLQLALMDTDKPLKDNKKLWKELGDEMEKRGIKGRPRNARAQAELAERVTSENKDYEIEIEMANKRVAVLETINNLNAENKAQELEKRGYTKEYVETLGLSEKVLTNTVEANNDLIKDEKESIKGTNEKIAANRKVLNTQKKISQNYQELNDAIGTSKQLANDLYNSFKELTEVLGGDGPAMIFADMGMSMANTVLDTIMLIVQMNAATIAAQGLGAAMKSASGIIGWIVMAIELLVQAITAVVNYAEKMRQMKLDILAEQVDNLKQKYDALAESIEKAWSYKQLEEYSKELEKVQAKMEDAQKDYIKLLESGKDGDAIDIAKEAQRKLDDGLSVDDLSKKERKALLSEEYQDYKEATDALAEMQKDHEEQKKELLEELGGVTDPKDAAEEFVDVWLDAYKETGDGLSGLNEKFDEFFENLIKKKAAMLVAEKALTGWVDAVNDALDPNKDGGYDITDDEQKRINVEAERAKKEANDLLLGIFEGIGVNKEGGLSGLQKGIQGLSEETGQIIEAYLNSIRGYISEQVTHTKNIYNILYDATRSESRALWVRLAKQ